jgi:hypothetical protein
MLYQYPGKLKRMYKVSGAGNLANSAVTRSFCSSRYSKTPVYFSTSKTDGEELKNMTKSGQSQSLYK